MSKQRLNNLRDRIEVIALGLVFIFSTTAITG